MGLLWDGTEKFSVEGLNFFPEAQRSGNSGGRACGRRSGGVPWWQESFLTLGRDGEPLLFEEPGETRKSGKLGLVDQSPWQTVQALAPLAVSAEEQQMAHEAERLADHEVDQAFATELAELAALEHENAGPVAALTAAAEGWPSYSS